MKEATQLAQDWFDVIRNEKSERGIISEVSSNVPNNFMIGDDFTFITTTLGSLNAKEISTNTDFAALMVRLLKEAGMEPGDKAGLIISGSFPALAVSAMAALQTLEMDAVLMSSLGSSTYGANQEEATWIDMENWLSHNEDIKFTSLIVSPGAENDLGEGLTGDGLKILKRAADRNHRDLYLPENLVASIEYKCGKFSDENIDILINIGGNQSALGGCSHAASLPNGLLREIKLCRHPDRGIVQEMNSKGVAVINLLNIRDLASDYGIDISPGIEYAESTNLFNNLTPDPFALAITLSIGLLSMFILFYRPGQGYRYGKSNDSKIKNII